MEVVRPDGTPSMILEGPNPTFRLVSLLLPIERPNILNLTTFHPRVIYDQGKGEDRAIP